MKIHTLNPSGIHHREIKGIRDLKDSLPEDWFAYTSLEMIDRRSGSLEIDLVICASDRILVVELKDWNGKLTSGGGRWQLNGNEMGKSPVTSVIEKSKKLASALRLHLGRENCPWVDACVLLTGSATREYLPLPEQEYTFGLEFFRKIGGRATFEKAFPHRSWFQGHLKTIKGELDAFFLKGDFRAQTRYYSEYRPEDTPIFKHPQSIYQEFFATKKEGRGYRALLRLWDFDSLAQTDAAYASHNARVKIAFREIDAIGYLKEVRPALEKQGVFLRPLSNEGRDQLSNHFYELYDLPKDILRLDDFIGRWGGKLRQSERLDLSRTLVSHVAELHELGVAHRDLGGHSLWLERPSQISISGFATASFPDQQTINEIRETIRAGSSVLPEDIFDAHSDKFRRDVFLLGCCVHQILFGVPPSSVDGVPQWHSPEDTRRLGEFSEWFARALNWDPVDRFENASEALQEFHRLEPKTPGSELNEGDFARFGADVPYQRYPITQPIASSADCQVYASEYSGKKVLVKVWFGARYQHGHSGSNFALISFLRRAQTLKEMCPPQCCRIAEFGLSPAGLFVAQEWQPGEDLVTALKTLTSEREVLALIKEFCDAVQSLHAQGLYHGDIKPANIIISGIGAGSPRITLIDLLDYCPAGTRRHTPAYSPPNIEAASAVQIDVYAVATVVNEITQALAEILSRNVVQTLQDAAKDLLALEADTPDISALSRAATALLEAPQPKATTSPFFVVFAKRQTTPVTILPDDGTLYVSAQPHRDQPDSTRVYYVSGATDSALFFYNLETGQFTGHAVRGSSYNEASRLAKKAEIRVPGTIKILPSDYDDYSSLLGILDEPARSTSGTENKSAELTPLEQPRLSAPEVTELWKSIINREEDVLPEATVAEPAEYNGSLGLYSIRISELTQPFDFAESEEVEISTVTKDGASRVLGSMDVGRSTATHLVLRPSMRGFSPPHINTKLRIQSRLHKSSLDRRRRAVERILDRRSVVYNLIDCISGARLPSESNRQLPSEGELAAEYGLNADQANAFRLCLSKSPLSLIQGPPGTGKTHLIAAFVHFAIKRAGSQNILLVSQSHEAVNNAADKIISLFERHDEDAPIVRVGMRNVLTDDLKPYHTSALRDTYGKKFRSELSDRVALAASSLALPEEFVREFHGVRRTLLPILRQLSGNVGSDEAALRSRERLLQSFLQIAERLHGERIEPKTSADEILNTVQNGLADRYNVTSPRALRKLENLVDLSFEWADVLTEETSDFDQFLVKTRPIVTGTCVGIGRWNLQLETNTFDWVIIDEAARCDPGELAVAMQVGTNIILVGDHLQLPPTLNEDLVALVAGDLGDCDRSLVRISDFKRIFDSAYGAEATAALHSQYRMVQPIGDLISTCFYKAVGGLETRRGPSPHYYALLPMRLRAAVIWIDTGGAGAETGEEKIGYSFQNVGEANAIVSFLQLLSRQTEFLEELSKDVAECRLEAGVGVIASYRAQSQLIREKILTAPIPDAFKSACKIDTVDSYQGKENPVILVSLTRANLHGDPGFVRSANRINVSLSRAKEKLVIVGSISFWRDQVGSGPMSQVISYIETKIAEKDSGYAVIHASELGNAI